MAELSCIACIFDCSCAACFIMPRKSAMNASFRLLEIVLSGRSAGSSALTSDSGGSGKLAHLDHLGAGKPRQHLLHPWIGFVGASRWLFCTVRSANAPSLPGAHWTRSSSAAGPLLQPARQFGQVRARGVLQAPARSGRPRSGRGGPGFERVLSMRSRFSPASATVRQSSRAHRRGADCLRGGAVISGAGGLAAGARRGGGAGAPPASGSRVEAEWRPTRARWAAAPPFWRSIRIASSGVGRSAAWAMRTSTMSAAAAAGSPPWPPRCP